MNSPFPELVKHYLKAVFSLNIPNIPPNLSPSFVNLIPSVNFHKINLNKLLDSKDKSIPIMKLHLTFEERFPALSVILDNDYSILSNEDSKTFATIYILQSINPTFLNDGEYFDDEIIRMLINLLTFSRRISDLAQLIDQSFIFLFDKIIKHPRYFLFVQDVVDYLKLVTKFPTPWFNPQLIFLQNILLEVIQDPNLSSFSIASSYLSTLFSHLSKIERKNMEGYNVENIYNSIQLIYNEIPEKHPEFACIDQYIKFRDDTIKIGIELSRLTKCHFAQYIPILIKSISNPFIPKEELEATLESFEYNTEVSEEKILEILSTKSQELNLDSYEPPTIPPIEAYLVKINHPIIQYHQYLTSTFSTESITSILQLMITEGSNEIINGDVSIRLFLFFEIDKLKNFSDISSTIIQANKKKLFFVGLQPAITIFSHPNSVILSVRQLISQVSFKLINSKKTADFFVPILADNLHKFVSNPQMFSEFFYFFGPCFSQMKFSNGPSYVDSFLNSASQALQIQQEMSMNNLPYHNETKILTLKALSRFVDAIKEQKPAMFKPSTFFSELLYMVFDSSISSIVLSIISKYCSIFSTCDKSSIADLFSRVLPVLDFCIRHIDICLNQCTQILYSFFVLLCGLNIDQVDVETNQRFFEKCRQFIYLEGSSIDTIAYSLMINHFTNQMHDENEWNKIAEIVQKHEMNPTMYESVLILLSHNTEPFTAFANRNATCLIPIVLRSKFCIDFLKKLVACLEKSIPDQIVFSQLGLSQELLKILNEDTDDKIWSLVLKLIQMIFVNSTRRDDLFAFFRLFSPVSKNKQTKHMEQLLNVVTNIVTYRPISYRSIIRFTSQGGYIELPRFDFRELAYGFTISMNILISNFRKSSDFITLFSFCNSTAHYKGELYSTGIKIISTLFHDPISISFRCKTNQWMVLSISFLSPCKIVAYINDEQVGIGSLDRQVNWPEGFQNNTLFGQGGSGFVEFHFSKAAIFINTSEYGFPDLMMNGKHLPNTIFLLDTRIYIEDYVREFKTKKKSYRIEKGEQFSDINPFSVTFDYTNGISFLISLFSQIDYDIESTGNSLILNNNLYLQLLLNIICGMIQLLDYEDKLMNIHLFEITAYFLYNSKKISMNEDLYSVFDNLRQSIEKKSKELGFVFIRSIFLNYQLWRNANADTLYRLFEVWLKSTSFMPDILSKELRPPLILNVLISLYETNSMNDSLREILFKILIESFSVKCTALDISMLFSVMHISKDNPKEIDEYLNMMSALVSKYPKLISETIVKTKWLISYDIPEIKLTLLKTFLRSDKEDEEKRGLYIQYILKNIKFISEQTQEEIDCSFSKYSEVYFNDQSNSLLLLPLLFGHTLYASEKACQDFSQRLTQKMNPQWFDDFTVFLVISFCITRHSISTNLVLQIITLSSDLFKKAFDLIYLFMKVCNRDLNQYLNKIAVESLEILFDDKFSQTLDPYINILIQYVSFHIIIDKFDCYNFSLDQTYKFLEGASTNDSQSPDLTFSQILDFFIGFSFEKASASFRYNLILEDGQWKDKEFVFHLLSKIYLMPKYDDYNFVLLISFLCNSIYGHKQVNFVLDQFIKKIGADESIWTPVLYQISQDRQKYLGAKDFMAKFGKTISKLKDDLPELYNKYCSEKMNKLAPKLRMNKELLFIHFMNYEYATEDISKKILHQLIEYNKEQQHQFGESWTHLETQLSYKLSPFFKDEFNTNYYKRRNYYDYKLRPSVFLRGKPDYTHQVNTEDDTKTDNNLDKFVGEIYFYSCKAVMSKIKSNTTGQFYFTNSKFIFISNSFKKTIIELSRISHFFWATSPVIDLNDGARVTFSNHSIQIFLNNCHCYLFTFLDETVSSLITHNYIKQESMTSINFFQSEPSTELINKHQIIKKWLQLELNNFDYLMLLNFLSGRSFLNKDSYPIFPNVFDSQNNFVDFANYKSVEMTAELSHKMISQYLSSYDPFKALKQSDDDFSLISNDVPPDFYITEMFYKNSEQLIEMRNGLESTEIKSQLHIWINKTFSSLLGQEHPQYITSEQKFNPGFAYCEKVISGLQNLNVYDLIIDEKSNSIYAITRDRGIYKSEAFAKPKFDLIGQVYFLSIYLSSTSRYLFFAYGINIGVVDLESKTLHKVVLNVPVIPKVTCITALYDMCAIGASDGSIALWILNEFSYLKNDSVSFSPLVSPEVQDPSPTLRIASSGPVQNISLNKSRRRSTSMMGFSSIKPETKDKSLRQSSSRNSFVAASSATSDSNDTSQKQSSDDNSEFLSPNLISQTVSSTKDKAFLFVHKTPVKSIQLSRLFNLCISIDIKGLLAISLLPTLELITTVQMDQSIIPQKLVFVEGFGTIVVLGEKLLDSNSKVSCLTSFTINGTLINQLVLDENVKIVDICPIISTNTGLDYIAAAYNNDAIIIHTAYSLKPKETVFRFNHPIKTIKYSQSSYIFIVCFHSQPDTDSNTPHIFPYFLN